jgi:lipoate---protein ligase
MKWNVIFDGCDSAQNHMDKDKQLLDNISSLDQPILRFYEWKGPSATYGHFINPKDHLDFSGVEKWGLSLGRRPTGGGIIFHLTDLAFSLLIPASHGSYSTNTLQNYAFVNTRITKALSNFNQGHAAHLLPTDAVPADASCLHFCMAKPTIYDIMISGKKVGGAAQRRTKDGFLHQGSISLVLPPESFLKDVLKADTKVLEEIKTHTFALSETGELENCRGELRELLINAFEMV